MCRAAGMEPIPIDGEKPLDEGDLRHIIEKEKTASDRKTSSKRERRGSRERTTRTSRERKRSVLPPLSARLPPSPLAFLGVARLSGGAFPLCTYPHGPSSIT